MFLEISVLLATFCWLGDLENFICSSKESVAGKWTILGVVGDLKSRIAGMCLLSETYPLSTLNGWVLPLGHTNYPIQPLPPHWRVEFSLWPHPNWLTCFPVSQVVGCRCTLLAGNSFVSLAGSGEQKNLCQQSPKMLKTASESFIHALVLFFGLFLKISCCVPLCLSSIQFTCVFPGFPGPCSGVLRVLEKYRSQPSITAAYYKCLLTWGLMLRTRERERERRGAE